MKKFLYSLILLLILLPQTRAFAQVSSDGTMSYNWPLVSAGATGQSVQLGGAIHTDTYTNPTPIAELEIRLHVSENPFSDTQAALTLVGDQSQVVGKVSLDSGAASGVEAGTGQYYFQVSGLSPDKTYYCRQVILQKDTQTVLDVNNSNCKFDGGHGIIPENSKLAQTLEDEKTYHFLAPLPGLDKLYDPDLCYQKKYVERSIPENSICDVGGFVSFVFKLFIGLSALVLVLRIMYEGYQYIVTDVPFLKANAKSDLMTALAGLLLALSAYVILNTINPKLVNNSFSISGVNLGVEEFKFSGSTESYITKNGVKTKVNSIKLKELLPYAQNVESKTGVNASTILAILWIETSFNTKDGDCAWDKPGVMPTGNPRDDQSAYKAIIQSIPGAGLNDHKVSCAIPGVGWGGGMGPSQHIPTYWKAYTPQIKQASGKNFADPWDLQDAIYAVGVHLAQDNGKNDPQNAACKYYSGHTCGTGAKYTSGPKTGQYANLDYLAKFNAALADIKSKI